MVFVRFMGIAIALLFFTSCGGSAPFIPAIGPFSGTFLVDGQTVGSFTLTTTGDLLGGTGSLEHNEQTVIVSISANINSRNLAGTVSNSSLGAGNFVGVFSDMEHVAGEFNYQDLGEISITTGTWTATTLLDEGS